MCEPVTAAAILAVASTAAQVVGEAKAAKAQAKAVRQSLKVSQEEARAEATSELFDQMRAARREKGRTMAAAGEAGLSLESGSVEALLLDSAMQTEFKNDRTLANLESRNRALVDQANAAMSRIQGPTPLSAALRVGASAAKGWADIETAKIERQRRAQANG
ncbi:MAG: hypothetical protein M3Q19_10695 [Pseudomonadota bacterium]|nr:hypothetical protein [Pseudomonadota bacterium]